MNLKLGERMKALIMIFTVFIGHAHASTFKEYFVSEELITRGCLEPGDHNALNTPQLYKNLKKQNKVKILEVSKKVLLLKKMNKDIEVFTYTDVGYSLALNKHQSMTITRLPELIGFELELIENSRCRKYLNFLTLEATR